MNKLKPWQIKLLACPKCKGKLFQRAGKLVCIKCSKKYGFKEGFPVLLPDLTQDVKMSMEKWDDYYEKKFKTKEYQSNLQDYQKNHQPKIVEQIDAVKKIRKGSVYLEIGSGLGYIGLHYGKKGAIVVGIDYSPSALKIAEILAKKNGIKNTLFVCGDITQMPFGNKTIDFVYGGGTIEHFKKTNVVIDEIYRILKRTGVSFNTVPCLNIGTIYRMRWGNIPNIPIIRQIFEYVNLTLLGGKHMTFGYELSFLRRTLHNLHKKAGFKKVKVSRFDTYLLLESVPKPLQPIFAKLCVESELFWPMYKVIGNK